MDAASDDTVGFRESSGKVRPWTDELFAGSPYEEEISFGQNRRSANGCFGHHWTSHVAFSVKIILIRPSSIQYADSDIGLSIQSISRNVRSHSMLSTIFIVSYQCWPRADLSLLMGSSAPTADGPAIWTERGSWKCFHDRHQSKLDVSATCGPCLGGFLIGVRLPLFSKDAAPVNLTRYFSIHLLHPQRLFHRVCDDASRFFSTRVTHAAAVWKIAVNYQWSRK